MQVVEGQQRPAVVGEAGIDVHQPQLVGQVAKLPGQGFLAAVHHAGVQEGGEGVDLVADGDIALCAGRTGAEERDAVSLVPDAGVIRWNLWHRGRPSQLTKAGTVGRSGSLPVHLPEGLDLTWEAACSPGPEGETQTPKQGFSGLPASSDYREASQGPQGITV